MRNWRFNLAVAALALAWLVEGLFDRVAGRIASLGRNLIVVGWGGAQQQPTGGGTPARAFPAKRFAGVPGLAAGVGGRPLNFAERGSFDRLQQRNNEETK